MYYIYGISGPSLLIESTDSMITFGRGIAVFKLMLPSIFDETCLTV